MTCLHECGGARSMTCLHECGGQRLTLLSRYGFNEAQRYGAFEVRLEQGTACP